TFPLVPASMRPLQYSIYRQLQLLGNVPAGEPFISSCGAYSMPSSATSRYCMHFSTIFNTLLQHLRVLSGTRWSVASGGFAGRRLERGPCNTVWFPTHAELSTRFLTPKAVTREATVPSQKRRAAHPRCVLFELDQSKPSDRLFHLSKCQLGKHQV